MSRYRKEIDMITKALDLNKNEPMSYEELRKVLFHVKDNVFLNVLSDMFAEGLLTKYQLPPTMYAESVERANKKRQSIIEANNRLSQIKNKFNEPYYKIEDAQKKYVAILENSNMENFESDMKTLGYTIASGYLMFKYQSIGEYLSNELLKMEIIEINQLTQKYGVLIERIDFNYMLEKLKQTYQIIEFEKGSYVNIKQLNQMGVYISDIHSYCSLVREYQNDGSCFSIKSLRKDGFYHSLDDLGMDAYTPQEGKK